MVRVDDAAAIIARVEAIQRSGPLAKKNAIDRHVPKKRLTIATGRLPRVSARRPAIKIPITPGTPLVMPLNAAMLDEEN